VPVTCPTPQPPGLQYSCLDCEAPNATSLESTEREGAFVADRAAAQGDIAPAGSEDPQRLWISMLLGVLALGGGVTLVYRNARRRRG
jgi:hypothetical protein